MNNPPVRGGLPQDCGNLLPFMEWMAEQMPGGFFVYRADPSQQIVYVNRATLRIFGCDTAAEFKALTGFTFPGMVHPQDYPAVQASIDAQLADGDNNDMDCVVYRIRRRDGTVRWVDDYGHRAQLPGIGMVYYVFLGDITEKRRMEEENRRDAQVIEGLSKKYASILLLDLDTGSARPYRLDDPHLAQTMGCPTGVVNDWHGALCQYAHRHVSPKDLDHYLEEIDPSRLHTRVLQEGSYTVNYRCHPAEGQTAFMTMTVVGIGRGDHQVVMGFQDVTQETLRVQRELVDRLKTEMELEQEKKVNELKSDFLFNISHDIRTPMNAIIGFSQLAKRHMDDRELLTQYLDRVGDSGAQLLALIDDLLEMSRLEYGHIELKSDPCDLREELNRVLDLFRPQAQEKCLELRAQLDLPREPVLVDAHRFRRIMSNLISNAVKFTPQNGSVLVRARQGQVSASGYTRYEFTVSDTGVGMSEEFMARLYQAFERENSSTKAGTIGTGLGLTIAKRLLNIMGGSIAVESRKGEGTTFTVSLPMKLAGSTAASPAPEVPDQRAKGEHRILLVEDIEINRMLAETILEDAGFLVESVPDGCDAVEAISSRPPRYYDLVLMDIQMPVMNGYEATRAIRALNRPDTKHLPILALSANAREEDQRMSMESGMNSHIAKPFHMAALIAAVNNHIDSASSLY